MFSTPLDGGILDRLAGLCLCLNQIHPEVSVIFKPTFFKEPEESLYAL